MINRGGTEAGARRKGLHITGIWEPVKQRDNTNRFAYVNDSYTRDNDQPMRRAKTSRACAEQSAAIAGKHHLDIMREGLANE